jgi:hypothetical protein
MPTAGLEPAILLGSRSKVGCVYQFRHVGYLPRGTARTVSANQRSGPAPASDCLNDSHKTCI